LAQVPNPTARLVNCPDCGHQVSKLALFCPGCGRKMKFEIAIMVVLIWMVVFMAMIGFALAIVIGILSTLR
jgi:hypothetical protein